MVETGIDLMRSSRCHKRAVPKICIIGLCWALSGIACAQPANSGIKHRIDATVGIEPGSSLIRPSREIKGTLTFFVRISANTRESRYFGVMSPSFSDIVISQNASVLVAQTPIWNEEVCHQRRGLPKVTVIQVNGSFVARQERLELMAAVRKIGLRVPSDELTPGIKLPDGTDDIGRYYAMRARTRDSLISIDLKIYEFDCPLRD